MRAAVRVAVSRRTAWVLVALLAALLAAEAWVIWFREPPAPTADRPVTVSDVTQAAAVDVAESSVKEILSTTWQDYDAEAAKARDLMTSDFAAKYGETSDEIKQAFVEAKTEVDINVAWAGVYRAGPDQVQALLFLDQVVTRAGRDPRTVPFRALVTVVPSDGRWLVADVDTR